MSKKKNYIYDIHDNKTNRKTYFFSYLHKRREIFKILKDPNLNF